MTPELPPSPRPRGAIAALALLTLAALPAVAVLAFSIHLLREGDRFRAFMLAAPAWLVLGTIVARGLLRAHRQGAEAAAARPWIRGALALSVPSLACAAWFIHELMNLRIVGV